MEVLYTWNLDFLLPLVLFTLLMFVFYYRTHRKQNQAFELMKESLKFQKITNQQLNLAVHELRNANHYLAELAGMEYVETSEIPAASNVSSAETMQKLNSQHKLYVGNIDYSATESELADYFSQYGEIELINIPVNRYNGKTRGFGFIKFVSKADAERAMEALHGTEFKGRQIQVNFAKERDSD